MIVCGLETSIPSKLPFNVVCADTDNAVLACCGFGEQNHQPIDVRHSIICNGICNRQILLWIFGLKLEVFPESTPLTSL